MEKDRFIGLSAPDKDKRLFSVNLSLYDTGESQAATETDGWFRQPYRLLSAGMIEGHWLDISENVLKEALPLFDKVIVHLNHDAWSLEDWLGQVTSPVWREAKDGIPAGINGMVSINQERDAKKGGDIILAMKEGIVKAGSVGMFISWHQSHPKLSERDFDRLLGQELDGEIVRYVVDKITAVKEFSLVHVGADPYAKAQAMLTAKDAADSKNLTDEKQPPETGENKEDVMLEEIKKMLGLKETATEVEVKAALSKHLERSAAFGAQLDGQREKCRAQLAIITKAGQTAPKAIEKLILSDDADVLGYAEGELTKLAQAAIPPTGRSSVPEQLEAPAKAHTADDDGEY